MGYITSCFTQRTHLWQTRPNISSCKGRVPLAKMSGDWFVDMKSTHIALWDMSEIPHKQCCEYQMLPQCQASFYRALQTDGKQTTWNCHHGLWYINQGKCIKSIHEGQFKGQAFLRRTYTVSKVSKTTAAHSGRCSLKIWMQKAHCVYHCHSLQRKGTQSCKSNEPHYLSPAIPALGDHIKAKTLAGSLKHAFHRGKEALKARLQKDSQINLWARALFKSNTKSIFTVKCLHNINTGRKINCQLSFNNVTGLLFHTLKRKKTKRLISEQFQIKRTCKWWYNV